MTTVNMSTPPQALESALAAIPKPFRSRLLTTYGSFKAAWINREFDTCGLRAGKFCEVMLRYLQQSLTGSHVAFGTKIPNFTDECRNLERLPKAAGPESLRVLMPRALDFAYTLRNKRDIGHVGGDVEANEIDAAAAARLIDWCLSELVRVVHPLSLEEAQDLLDAIAEREVALVWSVAGKRRVLNPRLSRSDQTLLLLYGELDSAVAVEDLADWIEVPRSHYKSRVLQPMHAKRLIEYDRATETVLLSPMGAAAAESIVADQSS
jgi:hypothetical protein